MDKVEKATANDIERYLAQAVREKFNESGTYIYTFDHDETYVYFDCETYDRDTLIRKTYRVSYSLDDVNVTLGDDKEEVVRETTYTVKDSEDTFVGKDLKKYVKDLVTECFSTKKKKDEKHFIEKFQEEEMICYDALYCPPDQADGDQEGMTETEIRKMVSDIKKKIDDGTMEANLFHKVPTKSFEWIDCFVSEWPVCMVGDQEVVKGQPIVVCKYHNKKAWELRKAGILKGPSIEGSAGTKREVTDE